MITLLVAAITATLAVSQIDRQPVQVMVVGTWHFDNPGRDVVNIRAEDVLTDRRQAELQAVTEGLAAFHPTKIMVERVAGAPDLFDPHYREFAPAELRRNRDERVQIAYRVAARLRIENVYAIDEQSTGDGPDYFPIDREVDYAKDHHASS